MKFILLILVAMQIVSAGLCSNTTSWQNNTSYKGGDKVLSANALYECKAAPYNGWCGQSGYEPGISLYWEQAWIQIEQCESSESFKFCETIPQWKAQAYNSGEKVIYNNQVFSCKPHPYTGWCSLEAYSPSSTLAAQAWNLEEECVSITSGAIQVKNGMLHFESPEVFKAYYQLAGEQVDDITPFHKKIEQQLGFISLKTHIEAQVATLDAANNLWQDNDPDFNSPIAYSDERAVMNLQMEYQVGEAIAKQLDEDLLVVILDGDLQTLTSLRNKDWTVLKQENIALYPQTEADFESRYGLDIEESTISATQSAMIYNNQFADTKINGTSTISAGAWTSGGAHYEVQSLLGFDLSQFEGKTITGAFLDLHADLENSIYGQGTYNSLPIGHSDLSGSNDFNFRRVTSNWNQNTVTWNTQPTTTAEHALSLPSSNSYNSDYIGMDITQLIKDAQSNNQTSFSLLMQLNNKDHYRAVQFGSLNYSQPAKQPSLRIYYQPSSTSTGTNNRTFSTCTINSITASELTLGTGEYDITANTTGATGATFNWNLDGAEFSGYSSEIYRFDGEGTKTICLSIQEGTGCNSNKCITIEVEKNVCEVDISAVYSGSGKYKFNATPRNTTGSIFTYEWDFGDGDTETTGFTTTHAYSLTGDYKACVSYFDPGNGCTANNCQEFYVNRSTCYVRCKEKGNVFYKNDSKISTKFKFRNNNILSWLFNESQVKGVVHHYKLKKRRRKSKWKKTKAEALLIEFKGYYVGLEDGLEGASYCGSTQRISTQTLKSKSNLKRMEFTRHLNNGIAVVGNDLIGVFESKDYNGNFIHGEVTFNPQGDNCKEINE